MQNNCKKKTGLYRDTKWRQRGVKQLQGDKETTKRRDKMVTKRHKITNRCKIMTNRCKTTTRRHKTRWWQRQQTDRNIKPRWRNADYPQFFSVLCRRGRGSSTLHVCAQGPSVSLSVHAWHLCTLFFISFSLQVLSCRLIVSPPYHPHHLHLSLLTFGWPFCLSLSLSLTHTHTHTHTHTPSTSLFTLALPEEQVRTDLISDWLIELLRLSLSTHTQTHRYTQLMALQGTETASGWNRDRQLINNDTDLPRRRSRMILYRRRLPAACMTSYLARWILGRLVLWLADW